MSEPWWPAGEFAAVGILAVLGFGLWLAFLLGLLVLVILGIRWLIRNTNDGPRGGPRGPAEDTAMATLRERFARGEIDADEFEQRRRALGG